MLTKEPDITTQGGATIRPSRCANLHFLMKRRTKVFSSDRSYILGRTWWVTGDIASRKRQFILTRENPYSSTPVDKWFYKKFERNHDGIAVEQTSMLYSRGSQHVRSRGNSKGHTDRRNNRSTASLRRTLDMKIITAEAYSPSLDEVFIYLKTSLKPTRGYPIVTAPGVTIL